MLMAEQGLEGGPATRAFSWTPFRPIHPRNIDQCCIVGQHARQAVAVPTMSNIANNHGVDVEPEAER
jgi:hypothetical protein